MMPLLYGIARKYNMVLLNKYYRGLVCRCNACGALLGYDPNDIFDNSYVKCPQCGFKILTKMQLDYDGLIREEKKDGETVVR